MANTLDTMTPEVLLRKIIDGSLTEFKDDTITGTIQNYKLRSMTNTTLINFPNLTWFYPNTFSYNDNLETLYFGNGSWVNNGSYTGGHLRDITKLKGIVIRPNVGTYPGTIYDNSFTNNSKMEYVDWNPNGWRYLTYSNCTVLTKIILRHNTIASISGSATSFDGSPFKSGGSGGEIYIPKVLYDHLGDGTSSDYKAATNWSTVDARGTITWKQIEGSEYERYYADGTPIGIINRDGLIASYDIGLASKWDTTTKMIASSIDTTLNAWNQPSQYGYNKPDTAGDVPTSFYDGYALCGLNIDFNGSAMSTYGSVITIEFCYASNDTSGINFFVGNRNENGTQVIGTVGPYPYTSFRTFRHIIIELTANGHQLYVDNVALNNGSTDRRNKGQARIVLNNNSYIGQVNVWNRALTADERAEHYQNYITNYHVGETAYDSNGNFVAT